MIERNKLLTSGWKNVDKYLVRDSDDSIKLAVIESEKVFLEVIRSKGYKEKSKEGMILRALKELRRPDSFLRARDKALKLVSEVGFGFDDPYSGKEVVESYKVAIGDLLFGAIEEKNLRSFKRRFWPIYFFFYTRRRFFKILLFWFIAVVLIMLFIADTDLGRNTFDLLIDKIHFIIRMILTIILLMFSILFFITFSIVIFESRARKKAKKEGK